MMTYNNQMKLEFVNKSENESFARVAVAAFISQLDPTIEELIEIKTALSEAVTNAIIHAYDTDEGMINIYCTVIDRTIEITIEDQGIGIEDINKAREPLFTSKPDQERSGMGFTVMETFVDKVNVDSVIGEGTRVFLKKTLSKDIELS